MANKKIYSIRIKEILEREVDVKAKSKEEALRKAKKAYENEEIIFSSYDFIGTNFKVGDLNDNKL